MQMTSTPQPVSVNGIVITAEQINAEMQYHPAPAVFDARYQALRALVVRELLLQRAAQLGIKEENYDSTIDKLLVHEVKVPDLTEAECQRYYDSNKARFFTSPLMEVSHILYLAPPDVEDARKQAFERSMNALKQIQQNPDLFESIALAESACPSSKEGGRLGQITRRQTLPAFEAALVKMKAGEISATPVATQVGYHIIKVDRRVEGAQLPYESVKEWITDHLQSQSWQHAVNQYLQLLAGDARIRGFAIKSSDIPLVQ
jgi:peptidyl-prolyl cis-trans isomerase C